jgi:hypothetical protein
MSGLTLVSFIVLGYNQEKFIREAVQSALLQTYDNLEIILSDDASSDRTFEIMVEEADRYKGPHRLILNRNPMNLGLTGNLSRAVQLGSGGFVVEQDGDDISFPYRTTKLVERWLRDPLRCDLVFSRTTRIAEDGRVLEQQNTRPMWIPTVEEVIRGKAFVAGGCVSSYSRSLFERFGPLDPRIKYTDGVMTFRAFVGSGCAFIDEPLIYYRVHSQSIVQTTIKDHESRRAGAQRASHAAIEAEDALRAWDLSGRKDKHLRWLLSRNLKYARLDALSSTGSRLAAFRCLLLALHTGRLNAARTFLRRDVLRWSG